MSRKSSVLAHVETFEQLLIQELLELYSVETQIIDFMPGLIKAATNHDLKQSLKDHFSETKKQRTRLEKIFHTLEQPPPSRHSLGMEGIIKEGEQLLSEDLDSHLRDVAIIAFAQKIEHYEICAYGTARAHAKQLTLSEVVNLLDETLDEEGNANKSLNKVAQGSWFSSGLNAIANNNSIGI